LNKKALRGFLKWRIENGELRMMDVSAYAETTLYSSLIQ